MKAATKATIKYLESQLVTQDDTHYTDEEMERQNSAINKSISAIKLIDECDTVFSLISMSTNHFTLTPQITSAINDVWPRIKQSMGYREDELEAKKGLDKVYQLRDQEGSEFGLIKTDCDFPTLHTMFTDYMNGELESLSDEEQKEIGYPEDCNTDGFCAYLEQCGFTVERVFVESDVMA